MLYLIIITIMLSVVVLNFVMLSVSYAVSLVTVMLSVFTLNVIRLNVVAPIFGLKNESDVVELGSVNQDY